MNFKYSVDKIKLEFQYVKKDRTQSFLDRFSYSSNSDGWYTSSALTKCRHNYLFGDEDSRIYLGIEPNWKTSSKYDNSIILEFNPNKVNPFLIDDLMWLRGYPLALIRVCSFDLAIDMGIDYKLLRMAKRDVRESFCKFGKRYTETQYLGQLGHNHIKLYNKAVEQKIKDVNWSRFEITVKEINSLSCSLSEFEDSIKLPKLYYLQEQLDFGYSELDDIQRIVLESIISDISVLYTIKNYRTRKKYEQLLFKFLNSVDININDMYKAYIDYANTFTGSQTFTADVDFHAFLLKNQTF
ncbi:MAG: hypothetical protein RR533_10155 [Carnobacterium sp.]